MNDHEVLTLEDARHKGITRIRRQIMCIEHANFELDAFCTVCMQVRSYLYEIFTPIRIFGA